MHFSLCLEDGTEVVSTFGEEPIAFTVGDGTLEPALESTLIGCKAGEVQTQQLSGSHIYGEWNRDNRQWIEREAFPANLELAEGQIIAFTTPAGDEVPGSVMQFEDARVLIDFNHPLSGRMVSFKSEIVAIGEKA
jgi:FKBP-type peptidyl-prolyl cis-trans isomerase SlpA